MIPRQEYELVSMSKLGVENGTALTCEDCGRTIVNFAVIKGKTDGKSYTVGLTCVKKLLKIRQVSFDLETQLGFEREEHMWDEAARTAKWVAKNLKEYEEKNLKPYVEIYDWHSDEENEDYFCVYIRTDEKYGGFQMKGRQLASTISMQPRFKKFFEKLAS